MPILQQYGPALLEQCANAEELARSLVSDWLTAYMFADLADPAAAAEQAAAFFADYGQHHSHALGIDRDQARGVGVVVDDLENDSDLQNAVLSVHHATLHTMAGPCVKMTENHLGKGIFRMQQAPAVQLPGQMPPAGVITPQ
jgi:hypothetical protein